MIAYLSSIDAPRSSAVLREELQIDSAFGDAAIKRYGGLIERKWTSAARLQRRVRFYSYELFEEDEERDD